MSRNTFDDARKGDPYECRIWAPHARQCSCETDSDSVEFPTVPHLRE